MDLAYSLLGFAFIIILGFISETFFDKTHIPDVIILVLFGLLIGPIMKYVSADTFAPIESVFVTLALILIIFEGGLSIKLHDLVKGAYLGGGIGILFFFAGVFITSAILIIFGYPFNVSLLMGAILGGTSSAIVMPMAKLLKVDNETNIILTLESTLTDVLCITGALTILQILSIQFVSISGLLYNLLSGFLISLFIGYVSAIVWVVLRHHFPPMNKAYMMTIAYLILVYVCAEFLNSNGAIAVLTFAICLGNMKKLFFFLKASDYKMIDGEKTFYSEISFFVKVFFFVYLGIIFSFGEFLPIVIGILITILTALIRPYIVNLLTKNKKDISPRSRIIMGIMGPKGMAAAVLAQIAFKSPIIGSYGKELSIITLSVIFFSILLTSGLVFYYERFVFGRAGRPAEKSSA